MPKILNLGCGSTKITGAVNVDGNKDLNPDLCFDIRKEFPIEDESFDAIYFFHCIEHLERKYHSSVLNHCWRVLKPGGKLFISYPEFEAILRNWLENKHNDRRFWEATIYGRQLYEGDYHVCAINSQDLTALLMAIGFECSYRPEPKQDHNTIFEAKKIGRPTSYEDILRKEIFHESK